MLVIVTQVYIRQGQQPGVYPVCSFLCCWKDWNTLHHIAHKILSTEITKGLREDEGKYAIRVNMVDSVSDNLADDHLIVYKRNQAFN